jgi:hypothetical protein
MSSPSNPSSSNTPSFNWLPPRPDTREIAARAAESAPDARPCLPALEPLDDRILLSAAVPTVDAPVGDKTVNTAVLANLLQGQFELLKAEVNALKFAPGGETQIKGESFLKHLTNTFLKLDDAFLKIGEAALVGDLVGYKEQQLKINDALLKIDALLPKSPLQETVKFLVTSLDIREGGQVVSDKEQEALLKLGDQFLKIDYALLKFAADPTAPQFKHGQEPSIKIDQAFIKIGAVLEQLDPELKADLSRTLNDIKIGTYAYLSTLRGEKPGGDGELSSIGQFTGGVALPKLATDDLLA